MLNSRNERELCFVVRIDAVGPIPGRDRVESAIIGGWTVMTRINQFKPGDLGIYFEIDSQVQAKEPFLFLESKHYKIKTQKYKTPEGHFWSQGLLMHPSDFGWTINSSGDCVIDKNNVAHCVNDESRFLTKELGVIYAEAEDNTRKANSVDKYKKMANRHQRIFKKPLVRWLMKREWGKKLMFLFFGKKKDKGNAFPKHFQYISPTDQERCENMTWVLNDKTPYIRTQKCDGSSGTYIVERKLFGRYEFYVCSRTVRQLNENQRCFHDINYYWEVANKYDIKNKLIDYLKKHPNLDYVCWQGEICAPKIQKNPHHLSKTHFYCFHMIDSKIGKYDIREAKKIWDFYNMETVPIDEELYILPDNFEEFKATATGMYAASVCEGQEDCAREGYVYYKSTDPNFSFKNVSRDYLLNH